MTRISDMTTLTTLPSSGAYAPIESAGINYKYDLGPVARSFRPDGAVGDGATDDHAAFIALAAAVNAAGGGTVVLEHGKTYLLNQNRTVSNGVLDINFANCNGLVIEGNGAKIKTKANWDRSVSTTRSIMPLRFDQCSNVIVRNLELDGSADTITNTSAASVPASYGLTLYGCDRVLIENVYTHHHIADGFRVDSTLNPVAGTYIASRNVTVRNLRAKFNVRLGASIIQVRGLLVEDSEFSYTCFNDEAGTTATFTNGGSPKAGVDVEPNYLPTSGTPVDILTGEITFRRCRFVGNASASFQCSSMTSTAYRTEHVNLEDCWFDHPDSVAGAGITFDAADSTISNCRFNMRDSTLYFCWNANGSAYQRFTGNTVYGRADASTGIITTQVGIGGRALIDHNSFIGTYTVALTAANVPFRFINPYVDARNNHFFIPKEAYVDATGTDIKIAVRQAGRRADGNRYQTDLLAASGSGGTAHFGVMYDQTATTVRNERFVGVAAGTADTIRPGDNATGLAVSHNTTQLYNNAADLTTTLTGDVTGAGVGSLTTTLAANAVTYAKFQQVAASSLVGNATGSLANATGITLAGGLAFSGSALTAAGALTPTSVTIGSGTALTKAVVYAPTLTPASVAAAVVAEQTFTVTGLTTADKVIVNPPAIANATGIAGARVSAADTLAIRFVNPTAGALTPTSGTYTVLAFRS